jgi:hypothetical protein
VRRVLAVAGAALVVGLALVALIVRKGAAEHAAAEERMRESGERLNEVRAITDRMSARTAEADRLAQLKARLAAEDPKTERALVAILGAPNSTTKIPAFKMLVWRFATREQSGDVISASVDDSGKIAQLTY